MTSSAPAIETLNAEAEAGNIELVQSSVNAEVGFMMFNEAQAALRRPGGTRGAWPRHSTATTYNEVVSLGLSEIASGPFPPGAPGYLEDTGFPTFDLERAKELVADYESRTGCTLGVHLRCSPTTRRTSVPPSSSRSNSRQRA